MLFRKSRAVGAVLTMVLAFGHWAWADGAGAQDEVQDTITSEMLANANLKKGKMVSLRCNACHTLGEGQPHKTGPNLYGIFGRQAGTQEDFFDRYSDVLRNADFRWTPDLLNQWLKGPKSFLPGNKMLFPGIAKEQDRIDLIAYLIEATGGLPVEDSVGVGADDQEATPEEAGGEAQPNQDPASIQD